MRKHGGTPSWRDKHVTPAAISPPSVARGRFLGGQQSGLAGCKRPPLFTRGASSCSSQGRRQGEPWGASPQLSAPTYLPTCGVPPLGAAAPPGGCGAAVSPAGLRPPTGWGRGGGGGGVPRSPPLVPWRRPPTAAGGATWWFPSRGASRRLGGRTLPPPPSTLSRAVPSFRPSLGPPALLADAVRCRLAGGGGRACECPRQRFRSAVSG